MRNPVLSLIIALVAGIFIGSWLVGPDQSNRKQAEDRSSVPVSGNGQHTSNRPGDRARKTIPGETSPVQNSAPSAEGSIQSSQHFDPESVSSPENHSQNPPVGSKGLESETEALNTARAFFERGLALNKVYNIHLYTDEQTLEARLEEQAKSRTDKEKSGTSIPYHPAGNQVVVQVILEGGIQSNLLLDTGASITVIGEHLARQGRFPVKGKIRLRNISRHEVIAKVVRLQSLQLGPLTRQDLEVAVADIPSLHHKGVDGILGMDVLQGRSLRIDRKRQEIILE